MLEVPDGLPWGTGWRGTYRMLDRDTVIIRASADCEVSLALEFDASDLNISVAKDTCGDRDTAEKIATYEAVAFHRVAGPGESVPALEPVPSGDVGQPRTDSSSARRLRPRPLGTVDGAPLGYLEYLPPEYENAEPRPLLIALHGSGQSGAGDSASLAQLYEFGLPPLIRDNRWPDKRPFVVLAPQHQQVFPAACITPAEIDEFLTFALAHYRVDPTRVYLIGLSCGAVGAWNYLAEHLNNVVAAAVLAAGGGYGAIDKAGCSLGQVPIWAFHGEHDDVVPVRFSVYPMARLQACADPPPLDARLSLYPEGAHDVWTRTYNLSAGYDIYDWLLSYTR